jgi:adenylate cyclase class IV
MGRNVEIKASVRDVGALRQRASQMATSAPSELEQDDTYFTCVNGRLKLRAFGDGTGELIFYRRAGAVGPKTSYYEVVPAHAPDLLRHALGRAWGEAGRVRKRRTVYMIGRTRVHIDQVEGLGTFVELEVVLAEGEDEASGVREARELMAALGIAETSLIDRGYVDLLTDAASGRLDPGVAP